MVTKNEQFITQMKLRELREQRTSLLLTYAELQVQTELATTEEEKLRILYEGLRGITFAGQPLHGDVSNLELLIRTARREESSAETLTFWRKNLEQELGQGRLRAEVVYTFGALLEEWTQHHTEGTIPDPQARQRQEELIDLLTERPLDPPQMETFLASLFTASNPQINQEKAAQLFSDELYKLLDPHELRDILTKMVRAIHFTTSVRSQAQSFLADEVLLKEFADALTIMLEHIDEWHWSEAGIPSHISLHLVKWRLFLDEDFPTLCLLEILGKRWQEAFASFFLSQPFPEQISQIPAFHLSTPFAQMARRFGRNNSSIASIPSSSQNTDDIWAEIDDQISYSIDPANSYSQYNSISQYRALTKSQINSIGDLMSYGAQPGQRSGSELALSLINAEVQLGRTVFPATPHYVLKADLKDFYPRLSPNLVLQILSHYGLPEKQLSFFQKYLRIPLQKSGQVVWTEQGVPNFHRLSDLLGELVMNLLEQYVQSQARVQIVRLVDDICLIAASEAEILKAWQALQTFCANCGLTLNQEKCGSACIGGEKPSVLPARQPTWLFLILDSEGQWQVNLPAFQAYLEQARSEFQRMTSLLSQIEVYNTHLNYLVRAFAMTVMLGEGHRQSVSAALRQFQQTFLDEQHGIVELLRSTIQRRFLGDASLTTLPEAWLYWPITAGGCGLLHGSILAEIFAQKEPQSSSILPPDRGPNWQTQSHEWGQYYYYHFLAPVSPNAPVPNQLMEALVNDFIQRGAELSAGKQKTLSPYWRWILYLYGPQIREHLGTFRFLITELVPLQIILKSYRQEEENSSGDTEIDAADTHPF